MTNGLHPRNRSDVAVQSASSLFSADVRWSFAIGLFCLGLAGCEDTAGTAPLAQTEVADPDLGTGMDGDVVVMCIGCGTTEAEYRATLTDRELYPDLTPGGAALARDLELQGFPYGRETALLSEAVAAYDCGAPVTDDTIAAFEVFVGTVAARRVGFTDPQDIDAVAGSFGFSIIGGADTESAGIRYDDQSAILGLNRCL